MRRWTKLVYSGVVVGAGAVVATVALNAGGGSTPIPLPKRIAYADELPKFTSCTQLRDWYREAALKEMTAYGLPGNGYGRFMTDAVLAAGAPVAAPKAAGAGEAFSSAGAVGNGSTGTNNLVAGVDEPDLVKTDGTHVVGVSGNRLYVTDVAGTKPHLLGSLKLPGYATELLLDGDRALVMSSDRWWGGPIGIMGKRGYWGGNRATTELALVDLSDPTKPKLLGSQEVDGTVLSSRLTGGTTRVVVSSAPALETTYPNVVYLPGLSQRLMDARQRAAERAALAKNRKIARTSPLGALEPSTTVRDATGHVVRSGQLTSCGDVRHPTVQSGAKTLTVLTMQLRDADPFAGEASTGIIAEGDLVAASADRLYVATSHWGSWFMPSENDQVTTSIHAFDTSVAGVTRYTASGTVDGYLLDRTAIDEKDGHLRIALTNGIPLPPKNEGSAPPASKVSESSVVVLDENAGKLVQVGRVDGLGRGEQVRSVRWLGDLAAVVTFQQLDPLYLVDLSVPTAPRLRGSLEITGYSGYLHPVGDGRLLGIGHEADTNGRVQEAQASLFDVSDPDHPRLIHRELLGNGWTAVENEPRAFTYLVDRKLALMPFSDESGIGSALSLSISASDISVSGRLASRQPQVIGYGYNEIMRLMPVGDDVVAVGTSSLQLVDPRTLHVTGGLALPVAEWNSD